MGVVEVSMAKRPTVDEAIRIGGKTTGFLASYDFCSELAEAYLKAPSRGSVYDSLVFIIFCGFNAGRIYGIRQERQKRKETRS